MRDGRLRRRGGERGADLRQGRHKCYGTLGHFTWQLLQVLNDLKLKSCQIQRHRPKKHSQLLNLLKKKYLQFFHVNLQRLHEGKKSLSTNSGHQGPNLARVLKCEEG